MQTVVAYNERPRHGEITAHGTVFPVSRRRLGDHSGFTLRIPANQRLIASNDRWQVSPPSTTVSALQIAGSYSMRIPGVPR